MEGATLTDHVSQVATEGWTVVPDVLSPEQCRELLDDLERLHAELGIEPAANTFEGTRTRRVYNLLVHGRLWQDLAVHPEVLPVVEGVLDPGCLLSSHSSIAIGPGESAQPIHADDQLIPLPKPHPPIICNTMWALTPFTEANGATRLVPGTHLADHSPEFGSEHPSIAAEMDAGSVLVWVGSLWHGGGANTTTDTRVGIAVNYCAGFIRQQENQQLGVPRDLVRTFPKRLQELVGYSIYNGLIGHIDKGHPRRLLDSDGDDSLIWDYAVPDGA